MLCFEEFGKKSVLLFPNRVCEYFCFKILDHIYSTKLHKINQGTYKHIMYGALKDILPDYFICELVKKIGKSVSFIYPCKPVEFAVFDYINICPLNVCHFIHCFDVAKYVQTKMNHVYWSYIDRNITNSIKYRKRKGTHYEERIKTLCDSLKNVTVIDSVSFLLFIRYKKALEPYFLLHSLLNNIAPIVRVKYSIGNTARACSFGENCRGGFVFIGCKTVSPTHTFNLNYCLCNKHLRELKSHHKMEFLS